MIILLRDQYMSIHPSINSSMRSYVKPKYTQNQAIGAQDIIRETFAYNKYLLSMGQLLKNNLIVVIVLLPQSGLYSI